MKRLVKLKPHLSNMIYRDFLISVSSICSINWIDSFHDVSEIVKFGGQSVIGILTVVYFVLKISKILKEK